MNAPILVTGGAGFLGGWLVRGLIERGEAVRVLDLPQAGWSQFAGQPVDIIPGDIRHRATVAAALRGCRAVIHVAGLPQLWTHPRGRFSQVNFQGAVNVLDEAVRAGCQRIVHVSSATIWPLHEEAVCRWHDAYGPYSRSKLRAERYALRRARDGTPIVIVSPTAPLGPGDWSRTPPTQMLLDVCQGRRREFVQTRLNLIDVRDAAAAMIGALAVGMPGERYLLGGTTVTLLELFQRLAALTGQPAPHRRVPYWLALLASVGLEGWADVVSRRAPLASVAAVQLTRRPPPPRRGDLQRLGVTPRPLDQTLAETVNWFRDVKWMRGS
jgi:dihydroflavonol-4-reductase